jgi:hypothetical protein
MKKITLSFIIFSLSHEEDIILIKEEFQVVRVSILLIKAFNFK